MLGESFLRSGVPAEAEQRFSIANVITLTPFPCNKYTTDSYPWFIGAKCTAWIAQQVKPRQSYLSLLTLKRMNHRTMMNTSSIKKTTESRTRGKATVEQNGIQEAVWELMLSPFETFFCTKKAACSRVGAHQMGCSYVCLHRMERSEPGKTWRCFKYDF